MTVASSTLLTAVRNLSVVFKGGQSALGHHWRLLDGDGQEVGRTKLYYDDLGGKTVGRLMRATGLSQRGDINAQVRDASGELAFRIFATRRTPTGRLDLKNAAGELIGSAQREEGGLVLLAPPSDTVVGRITRDEDQEFAYRILDASGGRVAVLTTRRVESKQPSIAEWVFLPEVAGNQVAYQATIHAGFASSREYHLLLDGEPPATEPLRTLVTLAPLIAAYAY